MVSLFKIRYNKHHSKFNLARHFIVLILIFVINIGQLFCQQPDENFKESSSILQLIKEGSPTNANRVIDSILTSIEDTTSVQYVEQLYYKGLVFDKLNKVKESEVFLQRAYNKSCLLDSTSVLNADIQNGLGYIMYDNNKVKQSIKHFKSVLKKYDNLFKSVHEKTGIAHYNLARSYTTRVKTYDLVVKHSDIAIGIFEQLENPPSEIVRSYMIKGVAQEGLSQLNRAKRNYDKALNLSNQHPDDRKVVINIYKNLGNYYNKIDDDITALANYNMALKMSLDINGKDHYQTNSILHNVALVQASLKNYNEAMAINQEILQSNIKLFGPYDKEVAYTYNNIGSTYSKMGEEDKALVYYKKAEDLYIKTLDPNSISLAINYLELGESYYAIEKYEQAIESYNKTFAIGKKVFGPDHIIIAACHYYTGIVLADMGKYEEALDEYNLTKTILGYDINDKSKLKSPSKAADLHFNIGNMYSYWYEDNPVDSLLLLAQENYRVGINLIDDARDNFESKGASDLLMEKYRSSFQNTLLNLFQLIQNDNFHESKLGYAEDMFLLIDNIKNNQLNDGIIQNNAIKYSNIPDSILTNESKLSNEILNLEYEIDRLKHFGIDSLIIRNATEVELGIVKKNYKNLLNYLELEFPSYYDLMHKNERTSMSSIQNELIQENEVVLNYFMDDKYIFSFALTNNNFIIDSIKVTDALTSEIDKYLNLLKNSNSLNTSNQSNKLYRIFLEKTINQLPQNVDKITIIPEGILGYIPFESFVIDTSINTYINDNYTVRYAYSMRLLAKQKKIPKKALKSMGAYAPYYKNTMIEIDSTGTRGDVASLSALPGSVKEIDQIKSIIELDQYTGSDATELAFMHTANKYKMLHLSMHTLVDEINPLESKLVFSLPKSSSSDGVLHAHELYSMDLNADLAVLSACNTGTGKLNNGEGIMSLNRAFTFAGVGATVMSLWKVPDDATAELMAYFYQNIKNGDSKSKALQKAKKLYLSSTVVPERKHPFYWSGFVMVGDDLPIEMNTSVDYKWYILIGIAFVVLIFFNFVRKYKN